MSRTTYPVILAAALSLTACAAEPANSGQKAAPVAAAAAQTAAPVVAGAINEAAIRASLETLAPGIEIDDISASSIQGFAQIVTSGRVVYLSNDGTRLLQGTLIDVATRENLTDSALAPIRKAALAAVGADRRIVFAPKDVKHRVTVFTDIDCGYCRKLHQHMDEFNRLGIAVEYLFFPRAGIGSESFDKSVSVWCASDRNAALTDAKAEKPVPKKTCNNPVTMDYDLGRRVGVDGTPAIYAADGSHIGGYLEPAALLARLDAIAQRQADQAGK